MAYEGSCDVVGIRFEHQYFWRAVLHCDGSLRDSVISRSLARICALAAWSATLETLIGLSTMCDYEHGSLAFDDCPFNALGNNNLKSRFHRCSL